MMRRGWLVGTALGLLVSLAWDAPASERAPLSNVQSALDKLSGELVDQNHPLSQRVEIARLFAGWPTAQVRAPLLVALKDPAPQLRAAAAQALGWSGNVEAVGALRDRAGMAEETAAVRAAATHALGSIGDRSVRDVLVAATRDPDAGVRQAGLWGLSLGPLADAADRTTYLLRLMEDQALDGLLRCDAIRAVVDVKEDRVTDTLVRVLEREPRQPIAFPEGSPSQMQIMELRRMQARDVSAWAAGALGELKAKSAIPLLLKTAEEPADYFLRQMSLTSLVNLAGQEAQPVFLRRLEDPLAENRVLAIMGLTSLGDKTPVGSILPRLTDPDSLVRAQAVVAVATLGDATARPVLEALQRNEIDARVLGVLEEALTRLPR